MELRSDAALTRALSLIAPGSPFREGLDRVLQSGRGGLIIIGDGPEVLNICSGGFLLDAAFSPQRLSELAKMDGAIIMASDVSRIARANVHLVPNPNVPTSETGTRHRTAERVARMLDTPVVAVSESRKQIQVYVGDQIRQVLPTSRLLERSNQALQTLERYRARLYQVSRKLTALEAQDLVAVRNVVEVLQRIEMVTRIATEIENNLIELGTDGRLVRLQLEELMEGVDDDRRLILTDYLQPESDMTAEEAMKALTELNDEALFDDLRMSRSLHLIGPANDLDETVEPRGFRLLSKLPHINEAHVVRVVEHFGSLRKILGATVEELEAVEGIGASRARALKDGAARLAGDSIIDQY